MRSCKKKNTQDLLIKLGRGDQRGVGRRKEKRGEDEGSERSSWGEDREGEQGNKYLGRGNHYGISEKPSTREILKIHKSDSR